jgi:hypothetical protein
MLHRFARETGAKEKKIDGRAPCSGETGPLSSGQRLAGAANWEAA